MDCLRDVAQGELLTISYIPLEHSATAADVKTSERNVRRERLRNDFFFLCQCDLCKEQEGVEGEKETEESSLHADRRGAENAAKKRQKC